MTSYERLRIIKAMVIVLFGCILSACASYKPLDPAFHQVLNNPYALDSGDILRVTVFGEPDLSNTYSVDKAGNISIPLIGTISARNSTSDQVEARIASGLRNGYIRNPDVSVEIDTYRPFYIFGEVGTPGQYSYVPSMTVQNAIATSGGFSARALQSDVDVTRQINGEVVTARVPLSDPILPGDTIYIRERLF